MEIIEEKCVDIPRGELGVKRTAQIKTCSYQP